jgi:CHASE2 domain-containing sensor protein
MKLKSKIFSFDYILSSLIVFIILSFFPIIFNLDFLNPIQTSLSDFYLTDIVFSQLRDNNLTPVDTNIILVNLGRLNRKGIASAINIINKNEPKVLGIDTFFRNPKDESGDSILEASLNNINNLVMVTELKNLNQDTKNFDTLVKSYSRFTKNAKTGFANLVIDLDNFKTARTFSVKESVVNTSELSFPSQILEIVFPEKYQKICNRNKQTEVINFRRNMSKYRTIDISELFSDSSDLSFIKGKIVLLGFLGETINQRVSEDLYFTPMNEKFIGKSFPDMYGMLIHANVLSQEISEDYIHTIPFWLINTIIILLIYLNMVLFGFIERNFENYYEPGSLLIVFTEITTLFLMVIFLFHWFNLLLELKNAYLAIGLCPTAFELYNGSIKPITLKLFRRKRHNEIIQ